DAVSSVQLDSRFPVIPVRALANKSSQRFTEFQRDVIDRYNCHEIELKDAQLEIEHFWAGALRSAVIDGDVENGSMMAGQSVGMVKEEQSAAEIILELVDEAVQTLDSREGA
ncbi:MAG: 2-nitropropane dioxygenase, partial [Planctomycetota bacterium]|nr:2-nitropropane dioxygenase [Planctomycetota bacterium]